MFDIDEILRGYNDRQYAEATVTTLATFLVEKGMIDVNDYVQYREEQFQNILKQIVERDKQVIEEWKKTKLENQ